MQLRAIIIDDEQKGINALTMLIEKHVPDVKVIAQCTRSEWGMECIENYKPDVLFLDIKMPKMTGFELLEKLEWKEFNLVFTTAYREFGLQALKSNAMDYLLKPIDPKDLGMAMDKIRNRLREKDQAPRFSFQDFQEIFSRMHRQRILIHSKTGVETVDRNDIVKLESNNNYTMIYLAEGRIVTVARPLKEFELQLCVEGSEFMRVHQSFIINLSKVARFLKTSENIVMSDDQKVPVSKSRRKHFFDWLKI